MWKYKRFSETHGEMQTVLRLMGNKESRGKIRRPWRGSCLWDADENEGNQSGSGTEQRTPLPFPRWPRIATLQGNPRSLPQPCSFHERQLSDSWTYRWREDCICSLEPHSSGALWEGGRIPPVPLKEAGSSRNELVLYRSCYREWSSVQLPTYWVGDQEQRGLWEDGMDRWPGTEAFSLHFLSPSPPPPPSMLTNHPE